MIGIYKIENLITNKIYIGSSLNIESRFLRHKNDLIKKRHKNIHLQREFDKYGSDCFTFQVLKVCSSDSLKENEQTYLDEIFSTNDYYLHYYNIGRDSSGGDNLTSHPNRNEIINKIKNGLIAKYSLETEIDKKKRREGLLGENNPNFGRKWSTDKRENMSLQRKGLPSKIKGKTFEEMHGEEKANRLKKEHSKKMKGKLVGDKNPFFGKNHTEENLKLFSESQKNKPNKAFAKKLKPFLIDNVVYLTLTEASNKLGIGYLTIRNRILSNKFINYTYITDTCLIDKLREDYINTDILYT